MSSSCYHLWESARNDASVVKVPLSASTPNQPVIPVLNRKESSLRSNAVPYELCAEFSVQARISFWGSMFSYQCY